MTTSQNEQQYEIPETIMQALVTSIDMMIVASRNLQLVYGALQMTVSQQDMMAEQSRFEQMRQKILDDVRPKEGEQQ